MEHTPHTNLSFFPSVTVKEGKYGRTYDLFSRMLAERVVFIAGKIDDLTAASVVPQLLFLEEDNEARPVTMYINSPGGHVTAGLAIYDTMQFIKPDIITVCIGHAASMGAVLLAAGAEDQRYALPHSRIMIHQPIGGAWGQASDVRIQADEMDNTKQVINEILAKHTGRHLGQIQEETDRDRFMSAKEAVEYGIIDKVRATR